jgi:hypothetical protein
MPITADPTKPAPVPIKNPEAALVSETAAKVPQLKPPVLKVEVA